MELKKQVLEHLGGKCVRCGFTDSRALQIDHVHADGSYDENRIIAGRFTGVYYKLVYKSVENNEGKYQLLCANCNVIKKIENRESALYRNGNSRFERNLLRKKLFGVDFEKAFRNRKRRKRLSKKYGFKV